MEGGSTVWTAARAERSRAPPPTRVACGTALGQPRGPIVIQATAGLGGAILAESTLSFLALGPCVSVSWGAPLDQGSSVVRINGAAIATTVLAFHLSGDALRDR